MSRSDDDSDSSSRGVRTVGISVSRDTGTKVDLILRVDGLRKKSNFFASLVTAFKKPSDPSKLCSNATFTVFNLTPSSLQLSLDVQTDRRRKKRKGNANRVDTYTCNVRKFPTNINPDSAEFETTSEHARFMQLFFKIMEPASGNCFILLTLMKTDDLATNWKEFQDTNGTIDASVL